MKVSGFPYLVVLLVCTVAGCSTNAEIERPQDASVLRASYTEASLIYRAFVGGTSVCQLTSLNQSDAELIDDYRVHLDADGCTVMHRDFLHDAAP